MSAIQIIAVICLAGVAVVLADGHGYEFKYGVEDHKTGDVKSQAEKSHGHGHVTGYYKLKEADGTERIVHYSADKHNGFTAKVERKGHAHHPKHYHKEHKEDHHGGSSYQSFNLKEHEHHHE